MRLESWEILVKIETPRFCLDINVQTKKSPLRSRNSSRSENFGIFWQFVLISIESYHISRSRFLNLLRFLGLIYLKKSLKCQDFSINLAASRQSWCVLTILTKILTLQSLDWKVSILKISTETKKSLSQQSRKSQQVLKVCLDRWRNLDLDLDWSRLLSPSGFHKFNHFNFRFPFTNNEVPS